MNRIALHQSTVHPLDPVALVEVARGAGLDSIGLRVAAVADVEPWWSRGIGSPMLPDLIEALLRGNAGGKDRATRRARFDKAHWEADRSVGRGDTATGRH